MKELVLSDNLSQIELEIKHHKNIAGQSIWEIGRRLNHVKEKDLAHGEFGNWLKKIEFSHYVANQFMKVAKELPNYSPSNSLGISALYLIATLPEEEREKEHILENGETKHVDEMTKRELEGVKRQLKENEARLDRAQKSEQIAIQKLEQEQNKEPKVIEKEIIKEVKPHDYDGLKSNNEQLEFSNRRLKETIKEVESRNEFVEQQYHNLLDQRKEVDEKSQRYDELTEEIEVLSQQRNRQAQQVEAIKDFNQFTRDVNVLLVKLSPIVYRDDIELLKESGITIRNYKELVSKVQSWCDDMNRKLNQPKIIEGVFTDD